MKSQTTTIPRVVFDRATTPLDHYLQHILATEWAQRRQVWYTYVQISPPDSQSAALVVQLERQMPTPHLDAAEERVN